MHSTSSAPELSLAARARLLPACCSNSNTLLHQFTAKLLWLKPAQTITYVSKVL